MKEYTCDYTCDRCDKKVEGNFFIKNDIVVIALMN